MMRQQIRMSNLPKFDTKGFMSYLPLIITGVAGLYVYNKFFKPTPEKVIDKLNEELSIVNKTTTEATQGAILEQRKKNLQSKGFTINSMHRSYANQLHQEIDSSWVDYDKIVSLVNKIGLDHDIQLVSVAYGQREIPNYRNAHPTSWAKDLFSGKNLYGDLKTHLITLLNEANEKKIKARLDKI